MRHGSTAIVRLPLFAALVGLAAACAKAPEPGKGPIPPKKGAVGATTAAATAAAGAARYPSLGKTEARITLVEISDFQCPFCSRAAETVKQVKAQWKDDVRVIFINQPLSFHKDARPAAVAALAAGRQGKYWEMHDKLFANAKALTRANFKAWAAELGLDAAAFAKDLDDSALLRHVDEDVAIANGLGVSGTPGFFINGAKLSGAQPFEKFKEIIDEELKKADAELAAGAKPNQLHARMWRKNSPALADKAIKWLIDGKVPPPAPPPKPEPEAKAPPAEDDKTVWKVELHGQEPVKGAPLAPVTLVEFTDFQCPFCSKVRPTLEEVVKAYPDQVRLVFKNQPLSFHANAQIAAEAALCAGDQGKFWEMEERLFSNQQTLGRAELPGHAKAVGIDEAAFAACLDGKKKRQQVLDDAAMAEKVTATGTPAFFINGRKISGAQPLDAFRRLIDEELGKAKALVAAGTPAADVYGKSIASGKQQLPPPILGDARFSFDLEGSPVHGDKGAPIQVVVYKDFECPFCGRVSAPLKAAASQHEGKVAIVFKHFPLSSQCNPGMSRDMHPGACQSAAWSFAALQQGKFWPFEDIIFNNFRTMMPREGDLPVRLAAQAQRLEAFARDLGMDVAAAKSYVDSRQWKPKLERDLAEAARAGVQGTPAVYVNGRLYSGKMTMDGFAETFGQILAGKL